jgi:hypothetical protein
VLKVATLFLGCGKIKKKKAPPPLSPPFSSLDPRRVSWKMAKGKGEGKMRWRRERGERRERRGSPGEEKGNGVWVFYSGVWF